MKISDEDPGTMTDRQIAAEYARLPAREGEPARRAVAGGRGEVRFGDMRADPAIRPTARETLACLDRRTRLVVEVRLRYGPSILFVSDLEGPGYDRGYRRVDAVVTGATR